jgi:putative endonuclease
VKEWYVYIVSNNAHTTYVGATGDLPSRVVEHKQRLYPNGFTARYTFDRLVYFEVLPNARTAAKRERQIKSWRREKKVALIQSKNPNWIDLSTSWAAALRTT